MLHCALWTTVVMLSGVVVLQGCGGSARNAVSQLPAEAIVRSTADGVDDPATGEPGLAASAVATTATGLSRQIIYSADIDVVVESFDGIAEQVVAIVKRFDAYVADSNLSGSTGASHNGTWTVRVPVARFEEFVDAAKGIGELRSAKTESQDISEEYYDNNARARNKTREEERLLALLADHPGKLDEVMAIERALSHVRDELERMQGRLRVLTDLTAMTSVQLSITEIRNYQPPQAPALATRIERAWNSSVGSVRSTGEETVVAATLLAPWLAMLGVCAAPFYGIVRTLRRRGR
jgi:Domain of unknown function (DUF4349)